MPGVRAPGAGDTSGEEVRARLSGRSKLWGLNHPIDLVRSTWKPSAPDGTKIRAVLGAHVNVAADLPSTDADIAGTLQVGKLTDNALGFVDYIPRFIAANGRPPGIIDRGY